MFKGLKVLGVIFSVGVLVGCGDAKEFEVVEDFTIELGEELPSGIVNYVRGIDQVEICKNAKLLLPEVEKKYLDLGVYIVKVDYLGEVKEVNVTVMDTTVPEIEVSELIEVDYGAKISSYEGKYKVTDYSTVSVDIDDSSVDWNTAGDYKIVVTATDSSGNVGTAEGVVRVKEKVVVTEVTKSKEEEKTKEVINSGKGITLSKVGFNNPSNYDFGKYQDYATQLYNTILSQNTFYLCFDFDSHEDGIDFTNKFNSYVLPIDICLFEVHYSTTERVAETNEWININQVIYDSNNFKGRIDLEKARTESYNACVSAGLYNGMSEREAVNKIVRWIANKMTYELNNAQAYEGFATGRGQCHTYAQMFKAMCNVAGIESEYVRGIVSGGGSHAWNKVKIGNNWYWVDVTWYDSTGRSTYTLSSSLWSSHTQC